jgi:hypothetical protein
MPLVVKQRQVATITQMGGSYTLRVTTTATEVEKATQGENKFHRNNMIIHLKQMRMIPLFVKHIAGLNDQNCYHVALSECE